MKLTSLASALFLTSVASAVMAQPAPFDMSPEKPASEGSSAPTPAPPGKSNGTAAVTVTAPSGPQPHKRYIIPTETLTLSGENDQKTWSVYLTAEQAKSGITLNLGYQNSIFVAPEASRLSVRINNTLIVDEAISSPAGVSERSYEIPYALLQPGANLISIQADQRHRTDCSTESTYELWSNIDPATTYLVYSGSDGIWSGIDDIKTLGSNAEGRTQFRLVAPALDQRRAAQPLLMLAQGLALLNNTPNQSIAIDNSEVLTPGKGEIAVLVGTAAELEPLLPSLGQTAQTGPLVAFVNQPGSEFPVLAVTGPDWRDVETAIERISTASHDGGMEQRQKYATSPWRFPDAPFLYSDSPIRLSELGVRTQEFAGRRMRVDFNVGIPSDFYADAYGQATILLDAAYSNAVEPGSHVDVYVNGNIATTVPLSATGGGIMRHFPVRTTLRHFKPGLNTIAIEAVLKTKADEICIPGSTADKTPRFALFDTSEFHMPDFARIGRRPNLAALSGTASPYRRPKSQPVPIFIGRNDPDTLTATATLLGRMAVAAGQPIDIELAASPAALSNRSGMFLGPLADMPPAVLNQLGIDSNSLSGWGQGGDRAIDEARTDQALDEWRSKVRGGPWHAPLTAISGWLKRNFDISTSSLSLSLSGEKKFVPSEDDTFLMAQNVNPTNDGTWTLVTAPSVKELRDGMLAMSAESNWGQIAGEIVTYEGSEKAVKSVPVSSFSFEQTQPPSLANYRLIAANWFSINILSYALAVGALALLLALATGKLLSILGRRS